MQTSLSPEEARLGIRSRRTIVPLVAFFFFAVGFGVYAPVWKGEFIWDDFFLVVANPLIRSPILLLEVFRHLLIPDAPGAFYRPVQNWSFIFDYWRGGLSPWVFHQTNLVLHAANAVWLFLLVRSWLTRLGGETEKRAGASAFICALLWLVHPAHNAAVAYISGRADSLALFFLLAGWWIWEKATERAGWRRRILFSGSLVAGFLALASKEMALVGCGLFLLYLWFFRPDFSPKERLVFTLALLGVVGVYGGFRQLPEVEGSSGATATLWSERPLLVLRALGDYARIFVFPQRLLMERQIVNVPILMRDPALADPCFPYLGWLGAGLILGLLAAVSFPGKGRSLRRFGVFWFAMAIWPVSNFFSLNATVAEHWLYLPSIGLFLILAGLLSDLNARHAAGATWFLLVCSLPLGARTWLRAEEWAEPQRFYESSIRAGGDSIRIRLNLAAWYRTHGELKTGEAILRSILARVPSYAAARQALALNLQAQGRQDEAEGLFQDNAARKNLTLSEKTLAVSQLRHSIKPEEAARKLREAYEAHPNSWKVAQAYADFFEGAQQPAAALQIIRSFCARRSWHYEAHLQLGGLLASGGDVRGAVAAWKRAALLDIWDVQALNFSVDLLSSTGNYAEAITLQKAAIERADNPEQRNLLSKIYENARQSGAGDKP